MLLPITIFLLVLLTETILFLGYSYFTASAYDIYVNFTKDERITKQRKLKRDLLKVKADLSATSSQDEFAKWAKLRRRLDKGMADLEKLNAEIGLAKTAFELQFKSFLWFIVHGSQIVMIFWFRKKPVFFLPPGWFGPAQRLLSLPFAPKGSVSVAVWFAVCRRAVKALTTTASSFSFMHTKTPEQVSS